MSTIRDVARLAGVGVGTVSRVISGKGSLSEKTRMQVIKAMRDLDYRPSATAQSLSNRKSGIIGVLIPRFGPVLYEKVLATVEDELRRKGKYFVLSSSLSADEASVSFLLSRDCDGALIFASEQTDERIFDVSQKFKNFGVINRFVTGIEDRCFWVDHKEGGRFAAQMLIEAGHRDIAVITGPNEARDSHLRRDGFFGELALHGLSVPPENIFQGDFRPSGGWNGSRYLTSGPRRFTAIFCFNDAMASGAVLYLRQNGIGVPNEIAVIGYDNLQYTEFLQPALTTVDSHVDLIVRNACRYIMNQCYEMDFPIETRIAPTLVIRESHYARSVT